MNSSENLRKRACNQKLSTTIMTHDDLAFSNNSEPKAPSPVPLVRASSSSSSGHCAASRSNCCALQKTISESAQQGSVALAVSRLHTDFDYYTYRMLREQKKMHGMAWEHICSMGVPRNNFPTVKH